MATYVYETIPREPDAVPLRFEFVQSMKDAPLKHHPETGEPVRRVITGGFGLMGVSSPATPAPKAAAAPASSGRCAAGCACHRGPRIPQL
jgi:hypothetical protein